jgi:hypothetical protein
VSKKVISKGEAMIYTNLWRDQTENHTGYYCRNSFGWYPLVKVGFKVLSGNSESSNYLRYQINKWVTSRHFWIKLKKVSRNES